MRTSRHLCACGRDALEIVRVASEDGLLLVAVCEDCLETGDYAAPGSPLADRRPLTPMASRSDDPEEPPLANAESDERGAA
jgi:hypothetical protein